MYNRVSQLCVHFFVHLWKQLWEPLRKPSHFATLLRGAATSLLIQTGSVSLIYGLQVSLGHWLGAAAYGTYEYVITLATILAFLGSMGLPGAVLRFISEYSVRQDWAHLRGVILGSWTQVAIASVLVAIGGTGFLSWLHEEKALENPLPLILGMWAVPLIALLRLQLEMGRGVKRIALAYVPSLIWHPLLLLLATSWMQQQQRLTSTSAIGLSLLSLVFVVGIQLLLFQQRLPLTVQQVRPAFALRRWLQVALPLMFIDGSFLILNQTDTLIIGSLLGSTEVGIYSAALKTAAWVSFVLISVNAIAAPMFATLHAQGDRQGLQRLVSGIARWMFFPALLVAGGLVLFAEPILSLFGKEFGAAKPAMAVLAIGQLVNVGAGSVGNLLNMTGHQNQCAKVVGCCAILNLLLNWISIPYLGILGAAISTAISMSLWNIWMNAMVVKHLGVNPSIVAAWQIPRS